MSSERGLQTADRCCETVVGGPGSMVLRRFPLYLS
jgi:hypothetical protein